MKLTEDILHKPIRMHIFGKKTKLPLGIILIVICLTLAAMLTRQLLLQDQWRTLTHEGYGFSIDYPATWNADRYGSSGYRNLENARADIGGIGTSVLIHQQTIDKPTLEDAAEWGQEIVLHKRNILFLSPRTEATVGIENYPALTQTFQEKIGLETNTTKVIYVVTENSAFAIEFNDVEKSEPIFEQMLASFRLFDGLID